MSCKIYLLKNNVNNKIYIGQTWAERLEDRMGKNGSQYKNSAYIYNAIKKYGAENFSYDLLAEVSSQEEADLLEGGYIIEYNSRNNRIGYNLRSGGSCGKHSEETKEKIRQSILNKEWSDEALQGRSRGGKQWKGKKRIPHTQEWKDNNSKMMIERHQKDGHPMLGKHHTDESKAKISEAGKGREFTAERNEKISKALKNPREQEILDSYLSGMKVKDICVKFSTGNATIYRILDRNGIDKSRPRNNWVGQKHSEETRAKMSEARKEYWVNKGSE